MGYLIPSAQELRQDYDLVEQLGLTYDEERIIWELLASLRRDISGRDTGVRPGRFGFAQLVWDRFKREEQINLVREVFEPLGYEVYTSNDQTTIYVRW